VVRSALLLQVSKSVEQTKVNVRELEGLLDGFLSAKAGPTMNAAG
jgi:hypothetical protein